MNGGRCFFQEIMEQVDSADKKHPAMEFRLTGRPSRDRLATPTGQAKYQEFWQD
jgi:hypothetical protein